MTTTSSQTLVDDLVKKGLLKDPQIREAFAKVPRHIFVPGASLEEVYSDKALPVRMDTDGNALCSAPMPSMLAYLMELLALEPGLNVLEIGTGTGYSSALLRELLGKKGKLTSVEIERDVANIAEEKMVHAGTSNINVVNTDGAEGYAPRAQYDRIISTVGVWDIPLPWIRQLKANGLIVAPVWLDGIQVSAAFSIQPDGTLYAEKMMPSAFVYMRGAAAGPNVRKRIGSTALSIISDDVDEIDPVSLHTLLSSDYEAVRLGQSLNTYEYWYGFLPYLMLSETEKNIFALYHITDGRKAYGIEGEGFLFLTPASACFVPYYGEGYAHNFAGADALLEVESVLNQWEGLGRPGIDCLRLRFMPRLIDMPEITEGKLYERYNHYLHVWMENCL